MARGTKLSENDHEREFSKYLPPLVFHSHATDSIPTSSADITLTALAQLGALRLRASRSFISLFNKSYQYILAEATPTLSLQDDDIYDKGDALWFGTTVLHRHAGPCSLLVEQRIRASLEGMADSDSVTVIPDLLEDDGFKATEFVSKTPTPHFYAGVPLRTPRGAIIGSYCVLDDCPRATLGSAQLRFLEDMATTIMSHLVLSRMREEHRQGEKMIRGIGSFVEGRSILRNWRATTGYNEVSYEPPRKYYVGEGQLDRHQQSLQAQGFSIIRQDAHGTTESKEKRNAGHVAESPFSLSDWSSSQVGANGFLASLSATGAFPSPRLSTTINADVRSASVTTPDFPLAHTTSSIPSQSTLPTLSRAANIIRESLEVEGAVFYTTNARSRVHSDHEISDSNTYAETLTEDGISTSSSTDTDTSLKSRGRCKILAHSESYTSSVNNEPPSPELSRFLGAFLESLYRRYPKGKIFHFDANGSLSSGSSGDESPAAAMVVPCGSTPDAEEPGEQYHQKREKTEKKMRKRKTESKQRPRDGAMLLKYFPEARSIGFFPLWDSRRKKWHAGGFIWTKQPNRSFTIEGQMSFCNAIGSAIMAEEIRLDALNSDQAKTELLGSISHELRSPLHGILGSVELLGSLPQTEFQADMIHSIETCGRTLLDTIEQLLDFSKVNHLSQQKKQMVFRNPLHVSTSRTRLEDPATRLDVITEEVVIAVAAGHNAQERASPRFSGDSPADTVHHSKSSVALKMSEDSTRSRIEDSGLTIDLNINKSMNMALHTDPGAWRRIVMNLFANSLKYTAAGHIKISLSARPVFKKQKGPFYNVQLTITDTGIGISAEYLRDRLFKPFSQENDLASGTGLGLSIVKQIVDSHNGKISVNSTQGIGTKISVSMRMEKDERVAPDSRDDLISAPVDSVAQRIKGKIACLISSDNFEAIEKPNHHGDNIELGASLKKTCRDWFGLTFCGESELEARECSMFFVLCPDSSQIDSISDKMRSLSSKIKPKTKGILFVICRPSDSSQRFLAASQEMLADFWFVQCIIQPFGVQKLANLILRGLDLQCRNAVSPVPLDTSSSTSNEADIPIRSLASLKNLVTSSSLSSQGLEMPPMEVDSSFASLSAPSEPSGHTNNSLLTRTESSETTKTTKLESSEGNKKKPQVFRQTSLHLVHERATDPAILIVDDNAINVKILATHLKRRKMRFLTAHNGQEALDIYTSNSATCRTILMDISMPVMDGLTSTRAIRTLEKLQGLKPSTIIVVTGLASAFVQQETQSSGADAYLAKPVRLKELDKVLAELEK